MTSATAGFKANLIHNLLFSANLQIRLDSGGLTARVVPLFGLSYTLPAR